MTTFPIATLPKPADAQRIAPWELAYFQARNRSRAHELVLMEFERSGITQAELARRLNKQPAVISRLLGGPGNWGLDTLSDLLFAISGAEIKYGVQYPLDGASRNYQMPDWFQTPTTIMTAAPRLKMFVAGSVPATSSTNAGTEPRINLSTTG